MKKSHLTLVVLALLVGFAGCQAYTTSQKTAALPLADADALWKYISVTEPYRQWRHWPGRSGVYPGRSPHGAYLRLYANEIALNALEKKIRPLPAGAIIVKENYGDDKMTLMAVTPMYKVSGYNPAGGDWFWGKYGPGGQVMAAGKPEGCISCHRAVMDNDWLFTPVE